MTRKVQVYRDGEPVSPEFEGTSPEPENEAFRWLLRHQGQSVDWALRHQGQSVDWALKHEGYEIRGEEPVTD